jgi:hypothetical protein
MTISMQDTFKSSPENLEQTKSYWIEWALTDNGRTDDTTYTAYTNKNNNQEWRERKYYYCEWD